MSTKRWKVYRHIVPAAHTRGFARGSVDEFADQNILLAVKQYMPVNNLTPAKGDVTLLMSGGLSVSKESFEPYFDALLDAAESSEAFRIRSIWIADPWNNGESYKLNEALVGDDPHWLDHTRDLYNLINHFANEMPQPLFGMGESWGAGHFMTINTWHPRLFAGILLLEPALGPGHEVKVSNMEGSFFGWPTKPKYFPGCMASKRQDRWKTRKEAIDHLSRTPFYSQMDQKVREVALQHDLIEVDDGNDTQITLATPKSVEAQYWARPDTPLEPEPPYPYYEQPAPPRTRTVPGFYRKEGLTFRAAVEQVTCPTMFLFGSKSMISQVPGYLDYFMRKTGTGTEGGGGVEKGQVTYAVIKEGAHAITLTHPTESAQAVVPWIAKTAKEWMADYERRRTSRPFSKTLSKEWMERIHALDDLPAPAYLSKQAKL